MNAHRDNARRRAAGGFTLLEMVVAMGLLSAFLMMLVQVMSTGVGIFDAGERGQELADRAHAVERTVRGTLEDMVGPTRQPFEPEPASARLVVGWAPCGLGTEPGAPRVQVLRSSVRLSSPDEERLLRDALLEVAEEDVGARGASAVEERLADLVAAHPRSGRGSMLLLPWPASDDGVYLELRRGLFASERGLGADHGLFDAELGGADLGPAFVQRFTDVVATGLLHVELALWSQFTRSWTAEPGGQGPEYCWDSARAGTLLAGSDARERFSLDRGPDSLRDARDDVFPRWVRVTLVVARGPQHAPDAFLTAPLGESDAAASVSRTDLLPGDGESPFVKIGAEWVRFGGVGSGGLHGLKRGQRGTRARAHAVGTGVLAGRELHVFVRLGHGRDADD